MDEQKKKKGLKTKYPPIPKELKELMADDFWLGNAHTLIELVAKERELINSELNQDSIVEELAFYRLAFKLEVIQVKSKAIASQEKRLLAFKERDKHAETLFLAAVAKIRGMHERVTYKTLVRELEKMDSPINGSVVYSFDNTKKPSVVSPAFLKTRLTKFNSSSY